MASSELLLLFFWCAASAQGLCMAVDEFWFHHRRGLGLWERISHPIDTAVFLFCLGLLLFSSSGSLSENWFFWLYCAVSAISCLLITKDEWVHTREAPAPEQWLHSVLFILHPLLLVSAWQVMKQETVGLGQATAGVSGLSISFQNPGRMAVSSLFLGALLFGLYQVSYWTCRKRGIPR